MSEPKPEGFGDPSILHTEFLVGDFDPRRIRVEITFEEGSAAHYEMMDAGKRLSGSPASPKPGEEPYIKVLDERDGALGMLARLEWAGTSYHHAQDAWSECPVCGEYAEEGVHNGEPKEYPLDGPTRGHTPSCRLALVLWGPPEASS